MTHLALVPDYPAAMTRFWRTDLLVTVAASPVAFARMVRRQREALGWTMRDLAARCSLSNPAISDIENCKYASIRDHSVRELMDALALTLADLRAEIAAMDDEQECAA